MALFKAGSIRNVSWLKDVFRPCSTHGVVADRKANMLRNELL